MLEPVQPRAPESTGKPGPTPSVALTASTQPPGSTLPLPVLDIGPWLARQSSADCQASRNPNRRCSGQGVGCQPSTAAGAVPGSGGRAGEHRLPGDQRPPRRPRRQRPFPGPGHPDCLLFSSSRPYVIDRLLSQLQPPATPCSVQSFDSAVLLADGTLLQSEHRGQAARQPARAALPGASAAPSPAELLQHTAR